MSRTTSLTTRRSVLGAGAAVGALGLASCVPPDSERAAGNGGGAGDDGAGSALRGSGTPDWLTCGNS